MSAAESREWIASFFRLHYPENKAPDAVEPCRGVRNNPGSAAQ